MSYVFKKLSEVEALTEVPEGAKVLAEANGQIVRVPGSGLGGSGGIKTAIIKSSDYDQAIQYAKGELPSPPSGDATYECINMPFEEAYEALANGELMAAHLMVVGQGAMNMPGVVLFLGTEINNAPCVSIGSEGSSFVLYWTADGISTTVPGT